MQLTSGLQVLGDQGGVLLSRARITLFDRGRHAPMQLCPIRLEL